ncbi:LOW QUALITY PROTEIN: cilia- and flagella-associated protein 337-like [Rhinophrynus dorsalis]
MMLRVTVFLCVLCILYSTVEGSALSHVPTSFHYWYDVKSPGNRSLLLWGDDNGGVNLLWLLKPQTGIFEKPFTQQPQTPHKIYMQELKDHKSLLSYQNIPDVHPEAITKLLYVPGQDLIITSSGSAQTSLVISINQKGKVYTWNISRFDVLNCGVQCFDYCRSMNLLATGGLDHKIRLWNQYVPVRPIAVLPEHNMSILDVAIYEPLRQIFSYSKDSVLKVWDISSQTCLQTLVLKFPCVQPGRIQEQGNFPFLLVQQTPPRLLLSYADYIGMLRLAQADPSEDTSVTHEAPLSGVLYNSFFHQVVTGSEDSTIAVWDVETGTKSLLLNNAHGQEEITCMVFDKSQRKLITGARNGTIKIWNVQNGLNLHRLEPVEEVEVTCVLPLKEQKYLSVGWNRKIVIYDVTKIDNMYIPANDSWGAGHLHKEDILSVDFCPSLGLLVTASFDGEIIVWNTETQRLYLYLRKCDRARSQPPVDKVFFLQQRSAQREAAILISSEAGTLHWWSVYGQQRMFGHFYAPDKVDESVFGLSSDESNSILVSGDTSGFIQVWDISHYALRAADQVQEQRPQLLYAWSAHDSTVVSVQHFLFDSEPYVVSGSTDRTAKLWSLDGRHVGTFGQSKNWNLRNHETFLDSIKNGHSVPNIEVRNKQSRGLSTEKQEKFRQDGIHAAEGHGTERKTKESFLTPREPPGDFGQGRENLSDPKTGGTGFTSKAVLGRCMQEELTKKSAAKTERRHLAADIDINKCNRFGQLCSPFQALTTSEVQEVTLPRNLSERMRIDSSVSTEPMDLWAVQTDKHVQPRAQRRKTSQTLQVKTPLCTEKIKAPRSCAV